ncbi:hypothetical protein QMK19_37695 [Streptomyces sp. H10-C2]|uniref:hypothetical protein n=1 Tax=unclassified Streptomyces TaxID=2593676 RepID=UPI0024B9709F|nr:MULTISPECIES: hypothetical protein [unclassified Streptomyces]MDJ0346865.1 hypothetical protein [Streptomyces sp. PH10-H1]MDJ0375187.1 hypothetical protein [Streptomyces sp. H10-C2]
MPGGPDGPPPGNRRTTTIAVSIVAAVAVIAAVVIGGVYLTGGGKDDTAADPGKSPSASQSATPSATPSPSNTTAAGSSGGGDDSRGAPSDVEIKPVVPGWQVVRRAERNVAFDVPPNWQLAGEGVLTGFEDKGKPMVTMGAPAYYKPHWCDKDERAAVGTKGANGAKSVQEAAEVQAETWAYWGYQENGKVTVAKTSAKPFTNSHGISGYSSSATAKNVPKTTKCTSDGAVFTVAWVDSTKALTVWVLYADRGAGVTDGVSDETITTIMGSIRELKKK